MFDEGKSRISAQDRKSRRWRLPRILQDRSPLPSGATMSPTSQKSKRALDWLNFFLAGALTGFGPFVALYLTSQDWTQVEIGSVLTIGGLTGLLVQVPGGELLDVIRSKRLLVGLGVGVIACAALSVALRPSFTPVLVAEVLLGVAGGFIGPAIAAISLGLVGNDELPDRLGRNQRFAASGGLATAGLMGLLGYMLPLQSIFFASAALAVPTLMALRAIHAEDIHFARACGAPPGDNYSAQPSRVARTAVGTNHRLLIFAGCIALFQLANASILPLVSEELGRGRGSSLVISALIFLPQIVVAALAPWVGRGAATWGRRPLLLIGVGALPIRAVCFALIENPFLLLAVQVLDGISGAAIDVLTPLIIADVTKGTGRFNLAQGIVGTFSGIGAAFSTTASGYIAQTLGGAAGFYFVVSVALTAVAVCWVFMPETKDVHARLRPLQ
jgi:MFS family permease